MAIGQPRGKHGMVPLYIYDPAIRSKRYCGSFATAELARAAEMEIAEIGRRNCRRCRKTFKPLGLEQFFCSDECVVKFVPRERKRIRYRNDDHWVYIARDDAGVVLYVGMTSTGLRRAREHGREMEWWPLVATMEIKHFGSREDAGTAETAAIAEHCPPFNTLGVPSVEA